MNKPLLTLATSALVAALTMFAPSAQAQQPKVAIGMSQGVNRLPTIIAEAKGFFKQEGLDVTLKPLARGALAIEGVASGSLQFAESAHVPFFAAVAKGVPLVAVGVAARGYYGKLVANNKNANLKTLADFKGKKIGTQMGSGMHTIFLMLLEKNGMKESDFVITNLRVNDMPAAMASSPDKFDAVLGWEPSMQRIVQGGHGKVVIGAKQFEDMANITYPFLLTTTRQYLKDHPDVVQKVLNAYAKADAYIQAHKDEARDIYIAEIKKRGAKLDKAAVEVMLYETDRYEGPAFTKKDLADLPATRDFLIKTGKIKSLPPLDQLINTSFGDKAEANLKK